MSVPVRPGSTDVSDMLDAAYRRFKACALKCLPLMLPAVLAVQAADIYWLLTGHRSARPFDPRDRAYYVLTFAGVLIFVWLMGAVVLRMRGLQAGRLRPVTDDLRDAAGSWPALFVASMLGCVLVLLGFVLLIAPGIWLSVCLAPLFPVVLLERLAPVAALRRCIELVRPRWVKTFAALLIAALIMLVCLFAVGIVMALVLVPFSTQAAVINAVSTTVSLLVAALAQLFFMSLALEIHSSASASA